MFRQCFDFEIVTFALLYLVKMGIFSCVNDKNKILVTIFENMKEDSETFDTY